MINIEHGDGIKPDLDLRKVGLGTKALTGDSRLDILERIVLRQQEDLNNHANMIMELRLELARMDKRNRDAK